MSWIPYFIGKERKIEISKKVEEIKNEHSLPPITWFKMSGIARQYNIDVYCYDWVLTPLSSREKSYIILPSYDETSHLAHELGHIVLDSGDESEVNYFAKELLGSFVKDHAIVALSSLRQMLDIFRDYRSNGPWKKIRGIRREISRHKTEEVYPSLELLFHEYKNFLRRKKP